MDRRLTRRSTLAVAIGPLAGCLDRSADTTYGSDDGAAAANSTADAGAAATSEEDRDADSTIPLADERLPLEYDPEELRDEVRSGGVPPDGIPSIDDPQFEPAEAVGDRLADGDPVFGLVRGDEVRAYPQSILVHHEIVNDEVGGDGVAVTYCPLTGTAMGFERGDVEFGVSGRLLNSNLVMYDREGESWWPQMLATAIDGVLAGSSLREVPVVWSTWGRWREAYPESDVLTSDTGYARNYDDDPYGAYDPPSGYYEEDSGTMFAPLAEDDRYPAKRMFFCARPREGLLAIDRETLREEGLVHLEREDADYLAASDPATGAGHLYRTDGDGEAFSLADGAVVDESGERHDPTDLPLERVYAYDAMWFAWAGFYPSTDVYD